jgi:hypothetical protein
MLMRSCVQCKACATAEERRRRESRPQVGPDMMKSTKKCTRYGWHSLIPNLIFVTLLYNSFGSSMHLVCLIIWTIPYGVA